MFFLLPFLILGAVVLSQRKDPPPRPVAQLATVSGGAPSPIAVLCVFLRSNRRPPPIVVQCAIAEAQLLGDRGLAADLRAKFYPETVEGQAAARARATTPPLAFDMGGASQDAPAPVDANDNATDQPAPAPSSPMSQDEIDAHQPMPPMVSSEPELAPSPSPAPVLAVVIAQSPIGGVQDAAWSAFCERLVRESPTYHSQRHIGRYRHRKDRLAQIGFDPEMLLGSPDVQDTALGADLADAHRHLVASGMTKHVGRAISIPDVEGTIPLTLSGVLGIASVAGLDGCVGWLEKKSDRKQFPHTTQAFLRTNGVF